MCRRFIPAFAEVLGDSGQTAQTKSDCLPLYKLLSFDAASGLAAGLRVH